jgi:hypothetical protein
LRRFAVRLSGLACGLALAVRPAGAAEAPRARVGPEDAFCGAVCAKRLERIFGCPCGWRGRPGQCAAFRPGARDLLPGDRHTWRETTARPVRIARDSRCVTAGCVLGRGVRGNGAAGSGPRRCASALEAAGQAARQLRRDPLSPGRYGAALPGLFSASPCTSRASCVNVARAGRRGAPKVRP